MNLTMIRHRQGLRKARFGEDDVAGAAPPNRKPRSLEYRDSLSNRRRAATSPSDRDLGLHIDLSGLNRER